jgi:hypothetical protein
MVTTLLLAVVFLHQVQNVLWDHAGKTTTHDIWLFHCVWFCATYHPHGGWMAQQPYAALLKMEQGATFMEPMTPEKLQALSDITRSTIWLMGASFVLGSLFTLLMLLILDFVRRNKAES